jgi:hypothetical protein
MSACLAHLLRMTAYEKHFPVPTLTGTPAFLCYGYSVEWQKLVKVNLPAKRGNAKDLSEVNYWLIGKAVLWWKLYMR